MLKKSTLLVILVTFNSPASPGQLSHHRKTLTAENVPGSLHHAAKTNNVEQALHLLRLGASKSRRDPETGRTPLETAQVYNAQEMITLLTKTTPIHPIYKVPHSPNRLFTQAPTKRAACAFVQECLEQNQDPAYKVTSSGNLLHFAIQHRLSHHLLRIILQRSAQINEANSEGKTALHLATDQGSLATILFLLRKGARTDIKDAYQRTPLECAIAHKNTCLISILRRACSYSPAHIKEDYDCTICMDTYTLSKDLISLPCKHRFHSSCIIRWKSKSDTCPCCRQPVPTRSRLTR